MKFQHKQAFLCSFRSKSAAELGPFSDGLSAEPLYPDNSVMQYMALREIALDRFPCLCSVPRFHGGGCIPLKDKLSRVYRIQAIIHSIDRLDDYAAGVRALIKSCLNFAAHGVSPW